MKVPIYISRLTDSPYSENLKEAFHFEDDDSLLQTIQELKNANPSCFLISGYRGVGKTSFINRIKEKLQNDTLFVTISVAKYDGYPVVIKKIIRQLYLSFITLKKPKLSSEFYSRFSLLYDRTFTDIKQSENLTSTRENLQKSEIRFDLKKIIPIILSAILAGCLSFQLFELKYINELLLAGALIWSFIAAFDFTSTKVKNASVSIELSRTTLYDNEIAEHHLFQILSDLKSIGVNSVIVFDELDKIKSRSKVENIINDLKALMLSGMSNFFVVAGQGLYYQLEKSHGYDDPIISTLFSKSIHIPFPKHSTLKKYLLNLVSDEHQTREGLLNAFLDSMILNAARVPRKLSNIVKQYLTWESDKAFIEIPEDLGSSYERDSKLLSVTTKVIDSDLVNITDSLPKSDFFIAQIHIWLIKIRSYVTSSWTLTDITQCKQYDLKVYPKEYISELDPLCELYFDRLIEEKLLNKSTDVNNNIVYEWTHGDNENLRNGEDLMIKSDPNFLTEFVELEQYIRGIYVDLIDEASLQNTKLSIKQMINKLIEKGAFAETWYNSTKLDDLIEVRNKLVHGDSVGKNELDIIQSSRFDISRLKSEFLEDYSYFVTKNYLKTFEVTKETSSGFDFVAKGDNAYILFDVKYVHTRQKATRNVNEIIDKFENYRKSFGHDSYYVLFYYQPNGRKSYDQFYYQFFDILNNKFPEISNRFFVFYTSEYRGDANTGRLETYLEQVLSKVLLKEHAILDNETFDNSENIIKEKAKTDWPDDYRMQLHEIEKQRVAVNELRKGKPNDLSDEEFNRIRSKVKEEWSTDFQMWLYEEQKQIESLRKLKNT